MEFVQELSRPFVNKLGGVREEFGAERARQQMAEQRAAALEAELEAPTEARESPQTAREGPERAEPQPSTSTVQEGVQRRPWWRRIIGG
jgi:sRNA-binding protein